MTQRHLRLFTVLFIALPAVLASAAEATIEVPERSPPRQDLIDSRDTVRKAERDRMYMQLLQQRQILAELRQRYSEQHPDVVATSRRVAELEARLREQGLLTTPPEGFRKDPPR